MRQTLNATFETFVQRVEQAKRGDDDRFFTYSTDNMSGDAFHIDADEVKEGNPDAMLAMNLVEGCNLEPITYCIVCRNGVSTCNAFKSGWVGGHHLPAAGDSRVTVLFSTEDGVLKVHGSSKTEVDNEWLHLWDGHNSACRRIVECILRTGKKQYKPDDAIWSDDYCRIGDVKAFKNQWGHVCTIIYMPENSPPIRYRCGGLQNYQTDLHVVPNITSRFDKHFEYNESKVYASHIAQHGLPPAMCRKWAGWGCMSASTIYKNLLFKAMPTLKLPCEMWSGQYETFGYAPWALWPDILEYYLKQPNCCTVVAIMLEVLGISTECTMGTMEIVLDAAVSRFPAGSLPLYSMTDGVKCFTVTSADGSAVELDANLWIVNHTTIWDQTKRRAGRTTQFAEKKTRHIAREHDIAQDAELFPARSLMRFADRKSAVRAPPISEPARWSPEWMERHAVVDSPAYKKMYAIVADLARRDGIEVDDAAVARMMFEHEQMEQMHAQMKISHI